MVSASTRIPLPITQPLENVTATVAALAREENATIVVDFRTMTSQLHDSLLRERLMATLSGFFGGKQRVLAGGVPEPDSHRMVAKVPTDLRLVVHNLYALGAKFLCRADA